MHETSYDRETFGKAAEGYELLVAWTCLTAAVSSPVGFPLNVCVFVCVWI